MKEENFLHLSNHEDIKEDNKRDNIEGRSFNSEKDIVYQSKEILQQNDKATKEEHISNYTEVNKTGLEEDKSNHLREIIYCNVIDNETEIKRKTSLITRFTIILITKYIAS